VDLTGQHVRLLVRVQEERQYRLKEIQFRNAEDGEAAAVFPLDQLRRRIPLADGEIFNVAKIRDGLTALTQMYGTEGYIDFTAQPNTDVDEESGEIGLFIDLDEQKQFHIAEIKVLGLEPAKEAALKWKVKAGDVYNNDLVERFFVDNKELLPADASPLDIEIRRDLKNGLVFLTFDFRRGCPVPPK
jgi:outer membrane protein assembly factor BamA